jgi:hypothetical protein
MLHNKTLVSEITKRLKKSENIRQEKINKTSNENCLFYLYIYINKPKYDLYQDVSFFKGLNQE